MEGIILTSSIIAAFCVGYFIAALRRERIIMRLERDAQQWEKRSNDWRTACFATVELRDRWRSLFNQMTEVKWNKSGDDLIEYDEDGVPRLVDVEKVFPS